MVNMVDKTIGSAGAWLLQNDYQNKRTDGVALSTPEWMVQIGDGILASASTVAGDNDYGGNGYVELLKWEARSSRDVRGLSTNQMLSSASLRHSHVEIHIPIGDYLPVLETKMHTAEELATITIVRLGNFAGQQMQEVQNIVFNECQIVFFEQSGDILILGFRFNSKTNTFTSFSQTGEQLGNAANSVDFTTGVGEDT